ncbi:MAG: hypothetical protein IJF28_05645 [Firmicutes bacterium]|nr:hypothetical protein [Bacillota bacterium]
MDITNRMLADLAGQLGIDQGVDSNGRRDAGISMDDVQKVADAYKGKSEQEVLSEISRIKEAIKKDRKTYEQQLKAVKALRPMMNAQQKAKLDQIIAILED